MKINFGIIVLTAILILHQNDQLTVKLVNSEKILLKTLMHQYLKRYVSIHPEFLIVSKWKIPLELVKHV